MTRNKHEHVVGRDPLPWAGTATSVEAMPVIQVHRTIIRLASSEDKVRPRPATVTTPTSTPSIRVRPIAR